MYKRQTYIFPTDHTGATANGTVDLGISGASAFKDLFLSDGIQFAGGGLIETDGTANVLEISGSNATNTGANIHFHGNTHSDASQLHFKNGSTTALIIGSGTLQTPTPATNNVRFGVSAGSQIQSGGDQNTFVGDLAGQFVSTGSNNTFLGYSAGKGITSGKLTGNRNIGIGRDAGLALQSGAAENVLVGCFAGDAITGGTSNTIIGDNAGSGMTNATGNVVVGHNALNDGAAGNNNVVIGNEAGFLATSITQCTIIGASAGSAAVMTGDNNTLVGRASGNILTSGSENTFIGAEAGDGTDDGASCVAVGFRALSANCGSNNVAVGGQAGQAVTGTENVFMGYTAGVSSTSCDRSVVIGNGAVSNAVMTGNRNTVIGAGAGNGLTSGVENVMIGDLAGTRGTDVSTGGSNILLGHDTGTHDAGGTAQIVIGGDFQGTGDYQAHLGFGSNVAVLSIDGSDTSWSASSDERLKENVTTSTAGLSFLNDLRPVTFNWKKKKDVPSDMTTYYEEGSDDPCMGFGKTHHGFICLLYTSPSPRD